MNIAVPLVSRRRERVLLVQKLQHVLPGFVLLADGADALGRGASGFALGIAVAEVVTSLLVIVAFVRFLRAVRRARSDSAHSAHHGVDWVDVLLSGMLATEALAHWHDRGHLPRPTILLAAVLLVLGLFHGRLMAARMRRRALRVTEQGVTIGGRFFTTFRAPWPAIARIDIDASTARVVRRDGRERRLNLGDLKVEAEVRDALLQARAQLGGAPPERA